MPGSRKGFTRPCARGFNYDQLLDSRPELWHEEISSELHGRCSGHISNYRKDPCSCPCHRKQHLDQNEREMVLHA